MDNGLIIIVSTFIITLIIAGAAQVIFHRQRKRHAVEYSLIWERFDAIKDTRNYNEIIELGNRLVFNTSLNEEHLKIIYYTAIKHKQWHPDFETLKLNAYNKRLDWDSHGRMY